MSDIDLTPVNSGLLEVSKAISKLTPVGAGTVTDVSVVTANGVSGSVATSTTTPAITLSLGAITPSTVAIGAGSAITSSGAGGALGTAAFTAATAYDAAGAAAAVVSDTAYNATTWDGVTTVAPSKNAVRDKFESLAFAASGANSDITALSGLTGTITSAQGTIVADTPALAITQTWNNAAVSFMPLTITATDTNSTGAATGFVNFKIGATSKFNVNKGGIVSAVQFNAATPVLGGGAGANLVADRIYVSSGTLNVGSSGLSNTVVLDGVTNQVNTKLSFSGTTNSFAAIGRDAVNGFTLQSAAGTATWNDASTAASGTVANRYLFGIAAPTLTATNATVTDTVASTVYIGGAPTAGTNNAVTTAYALNVAAGNVNLGTGITIANHTYGGIYIQDGSTPTAIAAGSGYTLLDQFNTAAGANGLANDVTPVKTSNKITITRAGTYKVHMTASATSGTNNVVFVMNVFNDGTLSPNVESHVKIGTTGDLVTFAAIGHITVAANKDLDIRVRHDNVGSVNFTIQDCNLIVERMGA